MEFTLTLPKNRIDELFALKFGKINLVTDLEEIKSGLTKLNITALSGIKLFGPNGEIDTKTDQPCWYDRHKFDHDLIRLPYRKCRKFGNTIYYGEGVFCSFNCCKAYLNEMKWQPKFEQSNILLNELFHKQNPNSTLKASCDWRLLSEVGSGDISISTFRQGNITYKKSHEIIFVPIIKKYEF